MNAAGIDVSSRKSTVAVLRPFSEVVHLPFDVAHSTEGLASLSKQLKALLEQSFPGIRKCFDSPVRSDGTQKWVAFAGIDPMPNQSGDKNVRSNKSSKRGSPYLRKTLFNVMWIYLKCAPQDEPVFQFLDRKRSEGKPFYFDLGFGHNGENVAVKMHGAALVFGIREHLAHSLQHPHALVADDELHLFCASIAVIRPSAS